MNEVSYKNILGKIMLVGLSYFNKNNELLEQQQIFGTVIKADKQGVKIKKSNGDIFSLPPDLSSTTVAKPGEYTLHSTGEVVVDPDYLSVWKICQPE